MATLLTELGHQLYAFLFSPPGGEWGYPFIRLPGLDTLVVIVALVVTSWFVLKMASARIETDEGITLTGLLVYGFAADLALRSLAPTTMAGVIESRGANGFLDVARSYGAIEYLSQFQSLAADLPMHARANLPGKALIFHLLLAVTESTRVMALAILALSTMVGGMVYFLVRQWFADRLVAVCAVLLYVFTPARTYFMPALNVVTPLFLLAPLCLLEVYLSSRKVWSLVALGAALYALVLFEPLPLVALPIALGQVLRDTNSRRLSWREVARIVGYPAAVVIAIHASMRLWLGFDVLSAFAAALDDARQFNAATHRPYLVWLFHNPMDFLMHSGVGQSAMFCLALSAGVGRLREKSVASLLADGTWLVLLTASVLTVLVLFGINRGETMRLWIFLGVFLQMVAARQCAHDRRWFHVVMALAIIESAVLTSAIGWVTV